MVTLKEIQKIVRKKDLYSGGSGTGKTHSALFDMLGLISAGMAKTAVIIDCEAGAIDEMEALMTGESEYANQNVFQKLFESVEYHPVSTWSEYKKLALSGVDVVLIDTLNHKHVLARHHIKDEIQKAGTVKVGKEMVKLTDPDSWTLDWEHYNQVYELETRFMEQLMHCGSHVIATLDPNLGKSNKQKGEQNAVDGYFSLIVDTHMEGKEYRGLIAKNRGKRANVDVKNPFYSVIKRYGDSDLLKVIEKVIGAE